MSSDGAMDKPRSVRPARGDDRGLASIALGVLLVLALIATIVMVFSDNPVWMRIGTLAALWAAFIGAFLVARYRRQAAAEAARVRDLHTVYELQLEREIAARREHELVVERDLRASVRAETGDSIMALRHEIAALREQLGALGVSLPEDRFAVGGPGTAGQLGAGSSLPSVPSERVAPRRRAAGSDSGPIGGFGSTPGAAPTPGVGPDATPSTERTERLSPVSEGPARAETSAGESRRPAVRPTGGIREPRPGAVAGTTPGPKARAETVTGPQAPATPQGTAQPQTPAPSGSATASGKVGKHESASTAEPDKAGNVEHASSPGSPAASGKAATSDKTTTPPQSHPRTAPAAEAAPPSRHGEGSGLSVAEIMARLGGDAEPTSGRRRRRAED
ncbi:DUF6779 domain-containing protein [Dietzia sp. ANT_WB102]|uniref:DUF6779 domain-containing protein n=1 Tax=Dietzia sp. ANT_WB102 TaxID=2597345 RepID=UPI0011ED5D1F|nr:DUF6779 domain-containing protein [Dietzia sp. ANT_WB102]KAA0917923.1 hypothetical protein FQ137_00445 [Dietzia sp. ANT_WB102]